MNLAVVDATTPSHEVVKLPIRKESDKRSAVTPVVIVDVVIVVADGIGGATVREAVQSLQIVEAMESPVTAPRPVGSGDGRVTRSSARRILSRQPLRAAVCLLVPLGSCGSVNGAAEEEVDGPAEAGAAL